MKADDHDVKQRALEKQLSREADERALASGEKTREQLCAENGAFAFPRERVHLEFPRLTKIKL